MKYNFYIEGHFYSKERIPKIYIEKQYFQSKPNELYKCCVTGISIYFDSINIFFPKGYNIDIDFEKLLVAGKLLFQTINKYRNEIILNEDEIEWLGNENSSIKLLNTYEWIIKDFIKHGLYIEMDEKEEVNSKGKIDWNKTIKNELPIIKQGQFIYTNIHTKKTKLRTDNYVSKIHNNIMVECIEKLGWLFNLDISLDYCELDLDKEKQLVILKQKLNETFKERDIQLIKKLISIIENKTSDLKNFEIVTPYFYTIWEEMLKIIFKHDHSLLRIMPKPYWLIENKKNYTTQIPDILIKNNDDLIIIDAKYYSIEFRKHNKYPGWESIVKQLYYSLSLATKFKNITNLFFYQNI